MEEVDIHLIERYLVNEMTPEERSRLESRAQSDPSFRKEMEAYQAVVEGLKMQDSKSLKARLKNLEQIRDKQTRVFTIGKNRNWWIAAAAVLLVGFLGWKFLFSFFDPGLKGGSNDQLYAEYFSPFRQDMTEPLEKGGENLSALEQFNVNYWNARYDLAISGFNAIDSTLKQNDNLKFRYANALIAVDQLDQAQAILEHIISNRQSQYSTEAKWYLGLIALKKGDIPLARSHLQSYRESQDAIRKKDADRLLKRLSM